MIKKANKLGFLFLVFLMGIYAQATKGSCQAHDNHPMIDQLCGTDVPISDAIFYENTNKEKVTLYRVWDKNYPPSKIARWWSLDDPRLMKKNEYRRKNAICPEWSPLNAIVRCTLKPGGQFMIGRTEAVSCRSYNIPASDTLQIFLVDPWYDIDETSCETWSWEE